jgi:hypothetical protein
MKWERIKRRWREGSPDGGVIFELLFYVLGMGIISVLVLVNLQSTITISAQSACEADGSSVSTSLSVYVSENPTVSPSTITPGTLVGNTISQWPTNNNARYIYGIATAATTVTYYTAPGTTSTAVVTGATPGSIWIAVPASLTTSPLVWQVYAGAQNCSTVH